MLLTGLVAASLTAAGASCAQNFASYEVTYVSERLFEIEATFHTPHDVVGVYHQPTDERPEAQSESILNLEAFAPDNSPVSISYAGEGDWKAEEAVSRIRYQVKADHDQVKWRHGADEIAHAFSGGYYFTGSAFFVGPFPEETTCPVDVAFSIPEDWKLTAPWAIDNTNGEALSMNDLHDNGFVVGPFDSVEQRAGNLLITSVFDPKIDDEVRPVVSNVLDKLLPAYTAYFEGQPAANYSTFHFAYGNSDGSAFQRSFTLQYEWPLNVTETPIWQHVLAHETMHLWTGAVERADHEIEWFTEGFTDYLAAKMLYQEGFLDDEGLRKQLAVIITRHQLGKRMSAGTSLRQAGENKGGNWFLIYGSGALMALILDAEMFVEEPGSFDQMMTALYHNDSEPFTFDRLIGFLNDHSNGRAGEIYERVDSGLRPNEINALLKPAGLGVAGYVDQTYISFNGDCRKKRHCAPAFIAGKRK